jgi:hypothetical protein
MAGRRYSESRFMAAQDLVFLFAECGARCPFSIAALSLSLLDRDPDLEPCATKDTREDKECEVSSESEWLTASLGQKVKK